MNFFKKFICKILGHKYFLYAKPKDKIWGSISWLKCSRCDKNFAINTRCEALLPMDDELFELSKPWLKIKHINK